MGDVINMRARHVTPAQQQALVLSSNLLRFIASGRSVDLDAPPSADNPQPDFGDALALSERVVKRLHGERETDAGKVWAQ